MRKYLLLAVMLLAGCATTSNDPVATYTQAGNVYHVTVTGKRRYMAHDPFTALFSSRYTASETLVLPRIDARVDGHEIPVKNAYYPPYGGKIEFSGQSMNIDLYYENADRKTRTALSWNGKYLLRKGD